jgi:hypothetical protein
VIANAGGIRKQRRVHLDGEAGSSRLASRDYRLHELGRFRVTGHTGDDQTLIDLKKNLAIVRNLTGLTINVGSVPLGMATAPAAAASHLAGELPLEQFSVVAKLLPNNLKAVTEAGRDRIERIKPAMWRSFRLGRLFTGRREVP